MNTKEIKKLSDHCNQLKNWNGFKYITDGGVLCFSKEVEDSVQKEIFINIEPIFKEIIKEKIKSYEYQIKLLAQDDDDIKNDKLDVISSQKIDGHQIHKTYRQAYKKIY